MKKRTLDFLRTTVAAGLVAWGCGADEAPAKSETRADAPAAKPAGPAGQAGAWPTFRGGFDLAGCADVKLPAALTRVWRVKVGAGLPSAPAAGDGMIFVISAGGEVKALSADGERQWSVKPGAGGAAAAAAGAGAGEAFPAPPCYAAGRLIVASDSGAVYALDGKDGRQKWVYRAGDIIQGTPNYRLAEGGKLNVFVMTQPMGRVFCLDGETGEELWQSEDTARTDGHMAVSGSRIAFGNCDAAVHVLSAVEGKWLGSVFVGEGCEMAGGTAIDGGHVFAGNRSGSLVCGDLKSYETVWTHEESAGEMFTTPAVSREWVVFAGGDGIVYGVRRKDGSRRWTHETDGIELPSPVIAGDKVVASSDGTLMLISLAQGRKLWSYAASDQLTSAAIVGASVVVGSGDGYVMSFAAAAPAKP